jgi:hypothetical protein
MPKAQPKPIVSPIKSFANRKRTEWRDRKGIDARLEAIRTGELIVLQESRTDRVIIAIVRHVKRFRRRHGYRYGIRIAEPMLDRAPAVRHLQGWQRREKL